MSSWAGYAPRFQLEFRPVRRRALRIDACATGNSPINALVLFGMLAELRSANDERLRSASLLV